jgi:hypothetical protein
MDFRTTRLWNSALEPKVGELDGGRARARLHNTFLGFRDRAGHLAAEIARELPELTVHDITHLDALWKTAELISGPAIELTPPEAFVLGGAILLHDLGMSVAAYRGGLAELQRTRDWRDAVAALLRQTLDRFPTQGELQVPPPDVATEATREVLRLRHAENASRLATQGWQDASGNAYHLIEDVELRKSFGDLIGRVAHSHHWPVSRLGQEFNRIIGAPSWCPHSWTVDPLKVACLLRLADACHIDTRRAPGFLRVLRQPRGNSATHWAFQERLAKPRLDGERLVFSSGSPFPQEEASAWWLCLDTLSMVDRELRQVDALLADVGRPRLAARGVAGVEDPARLVELIRTEGWLPVDTRLRVGDIPLLISRLGGRQLYGNEPRVPLRELLQNATDAVRARRLQENRPEGWGDVVVRLGGDESGYWVEVEDTGLGMSQAVLTGPLIEFGTSYWSSPLAREEYPGLLAKGFQPTGRYGIGFFSVFIWGDRVSVTTRRADEAQRDTRVLEFSAGLASRPLLRPATEEERLLEGGTRVRVWLKNHPTEPGGVLYMSQELRSWTLHDTLREFSPCADANVYVEEFSSARSCAIPSANWLNMDGVELLQRLSEGGAGDSLVPEDLGRLGRNLRPLRGATGQLLGRACISAAYELLGSCFARPWGHISDGVFRGGWLEDIAGILVGAPRTASRMEAWPLVDRDTLAAWASEQARLWSQEPLSKEALFKVAQVVRTCGGDVSGLPVAGNFVETMTPEDITRRSWASEVLLLEMPDPRSSQHLWQKHLEALPLGGQYTEQELSQRVLGTSVKVLGAIGMDRQGVNSNHVWPPWCVEETHDIPRYSLAWVALESLARAWTTTVEAILECSLFGPQRMNIQLANGTEGSVICTAVLKKPAQPAGEVGAGS